MKTQSKQQVVSYFVNHPCRFQYLMWRLPPLWKPDKQKYSKHINLGKFLREPRKSPCEMTCWHCTVHFISHSVSQLMWDRGTKCKTLVTLNQTRTPHFPQKFPLFSQAGTKHASCRCLRFTLLPMQAWKALIYSWILAFRFCSLFQWKWINRCSKYETNCHSTFNMSLSDSGKLLPLRVQFHKCSYILPQIMTLHLSYHDLWRDLRRT